MSNDNKGEIVLFQTEDGQTKLEVQLQDETVWLTIDQMAELFQRNRSTISRHIKRIYDDGELSKDTTCAKFACVVNRGIRGKVDDELDFYNLDMIISVGYRVHSHRGVQFRMWATAVLKEYLKKGFVLNDELLKRAGGGNYFDELLERIRDMENLAHDEWKASNWRINGRAHGMGRVALKEMDDFITECLSQAFSLKDKTAIDIKGLDDLSDMTQVYRVADILLQDPSNDFSTVLRR